MNRSRSIVLSIVLFTITAANASAQSIHYGLEAGTNIFKMGGMSFDNKSKFGYSAGVYSDIQIHGRWGLQPALLFNEYSAKTADQFNNLYHGASFQNVNLSYVSLPILVTFKTSDLFTILAGPQYGYLVYQTQDLIRDPAEPRNVFAKNDLSIVFGGQLNLGRIRFGGRYVIGVTELNNLPDKQVDSWKTQGFQFYLTFRVK